MSQQLGKKNGNRRTLAETPPPGSPTNVTANVEFISGRTAQEWMASYGYDRQRNIYQPHVQELGYVLTRNQYSIQGIILCECNEQWHITNGWHRLSAIAKTFGDADDQGTMEVVIRKFGLTEDELAREYSRTDQGKPRRIDDTLRAHGLGSEHGLDGVQVKAVAAGVKLIQSDFAYTKPETRNRLHLKNQDEQVEQVHAWLPAGARFFKAITKPKKGRYRHLKLAPTVAVGLVTCHSQPEKAEEFWYTLAHETMEPSHPCQALLRYFSEVPEERTKPPLVARRVIRAWNAFYNGEEISQIKKQDADKPVEIAGHRMNPRPEPRPPTDAKGGTKEEVGGLSGRPRHGGSG